MTDNEFNIILAHLQAYLESDKTFIQNPFMVGNVTRAAKILNELFPDTEVIVKDDPLQMGAIILAVESFDIVVRGQRELDLFAELTTLIDNFEVYQTKQGNIHLSVVIQNVLVRIPEGK